MNIFKNIFVLGAAVFFAVMWGLLIRKHVAGGQAVAPDYSRLLGPGEQRRETTLGIYFLGQRFGKTHTVMTRGSDRGLTIRSETEIELNPGLKPVTGISGKIDLEFVAHVGPLSGLERLSFRSRKLNLNLHGYRRDGSLAMTGSLGQEQISTTLSLDESRFVTGIFSPLSGLPRLSENAVGQEWQLHMVNPIFGQVEKVTARLESSRTVTLDLEEVRVFRLSLSTSTNSWESWLTEDGQILVQGTPIGLTLKREDVDPKVIESLTEEADEEEDRNAGDDTRARSAKPRRGADTPLRRPCPLPCRAISRC